MVSHPLYANIIIIIIIINFTFGVCQQFGETIDRIIPASQILGKEQHIKRQLDFNMCKEIGQKLDSEHWYEYGRTKISRNKV